MLKVAFLLLSQEEGSVQKLHCELGKKFGTFDGGCFSGKSRLIPNGCTRLPLTVEIFHHEGDVEFQYIYSPDLYEKKRIHALAQRVQNLLKS